jgi:NAD(P)-dependent dehydrogenase (short-subunit alcohol dehydrogenase family)
MAVSNVKSGRRTKAQALRASNPMTGQVAIVTGAERGIGRGLAVGLARAGARLLLNYHLSKADVNETVRLVREAGSEAFVVKGDIGVPATAQKLVKTAYQRFGRLDTIVNNAGIHRYKYLAQVTEADWEAQLSVNLKGPFFLSQQAVAAWRRHKTSGQIINITSCGAEIPFPASAAYNASKFGLLGLTRQLALELAPEGIRVNAVAPGVVHTSINDELLRQPGYREAWQRVIPAGRVAEPADLVGAVLFLCSDASKYITGQQLAVDGGWGINPAWGVSPE